MLTAEKAREETIVAIKFRASKTTTWIKTQLEGIETMILRQTALGNYRTSYTVTVENTVEVESPHLQIEKLTTALRDNGYHVDYTHDATHTADSRYSLKISWEEKK